MDFKEIVQRGLDEYLDGLRKVLHGLTAAERLATLRYLDGLTPEDLERCPEPERHPGYTIGRMLIHLIVEESQHLGQVAYLRGMQRGLECTTSWPSSRTPFPA